MMQINKIEKGDSPKSHLVIGSKRFWTRIAYNYWNLCIENGVERRRFELFMFTSPLHLLKLILHERKELKFATKALRQASSCQRKPSIHSLQGLLNRRRLNSKATRKWKTMKCIMI